jgi:HK97 family phage major capsid protein
MSAEHETRIAEIRDNLFALNEQSRNIQARADAENRELTADEESAIDAIFAEFKKQEAELDRRQKLADVAAKMSQRVGPKADPQMPGSRYGDYGSSAARGEPLFRNAVTGETVRAFRGTAPMHPQADAPLGDVLQALLLNDPSHLPADVRASLTVGSDTGGGYLAAPALSQRVVDLARANSVCMKAGAVTVPMAGAELTIARLTGDPTTQWRGETQGVTASTPTFGRYTLRPRTCAAVVPVSLELLEDTANAGRLIEQALTAALGVEIDRVILEGYQAHEPTGVCYTSGVNSQIGVGAITDYTEITTAIRDILSANFAGEIADLAWIQNPRVAATYDGLVTGLASDKTPLQPTPWASQLKRYFTTNLSPTGSPLTSYQVIGDFREVLVGARTSGVIIDVIDSGAVTDSAGTSWNATSQFLRHIRARVRVDVCVMRPGFFAVLEGCR